MRMLRRPFGLVLAVIFVAACLPRGDDLPASFNEYLGDASYSFVPGAPGVSVTPAVAVVAALRGKVGLGFGHIRAFISGPYWPILGRLHCDALEDDECLDGPDLQPGEELPVWVLVYATRKDRFGDVAWVVVDAVTGALTGDYLKAHDPLFAR